MSLNWCMLTLSVLLCTSFCQAIQTGDITVIYDISVNTSEALSVIEDEYLSFTLDFSLKVNPEMPWYSLNFSHPRVHTLAKGLSPAILRFGGTTCDTAVFYNITTKEQQDEIIKLNSKAIDNDSKNYYIAIFPDDIDKLYSLARSAGGRLLYDLSIQKRYGPQWDSTNARQIMRYVIEKGYAPYIDFELGNEPPYGKFTKAAFNATGERIAKDFLILRQVMDFFPEFNNSRLVGPDVETPRDGTYSGDQPTIMRDFVENIQRNVSAITAHHYYFTGPIAKIEQFYDLNYFHLLESTLPKLRETVYKAANGPVDLWIGETSDSNLGGTPHITDRFASGFLWLDKLGLAARNEFKMVIRQTFYGFNNTANYPLLNSSLYPNPDYWLSYVYKKLVGRTVLSVDVPVTQSQSIGEKINGCVDGLLRAYAHCTSLRSGYKQGSIVVYAINLNTDYSAMLDFNGLWNFTKTWTDVYIMTPENGDIKSSFVQLNNKTMMLIDDYTLPDIKPLSIPFDSIKLPPLSYGFVVFKAQPGNTVSELCVKF